MKINVLIKLIGISSFLCSCGSEIKTFSIIIYSKEPLDGISSESNLNQLNQIKQSIPKFENNGIQYVCESASFVRLDLDSTGKIDTRHTIANDIKIKMGVELSSEDILNDYQDSSNIQFPGFLNYPKGKSNLDFPIDCILIDNLDTVETIIQHEVAASNEKVTIKIGIKPNVIIEPIIIEEKVDDILAKKEEKSEESNIEEKLPPLISRDLPKLKISLRISDDERELLWHDNSKHSESQTTYDLVILKNNQQILSKKNLTLNKISCADLNSSGILNTDCSYIIQISAIRKADNTMRTEVYDIELVSSDKFFPRCTLNRLDE